MGEDIYRRFPKTQAIFQSAAAGFDLRKACFNSTSTMLDDTRYTQPCMAAFAAAVVTVLKDAGMSCDMTMGLSLGEYNALYTSGVLETDQLLSLLAFRGQIMADAIANATSGMVAVLGLADSNVEDCIKEAAEKTGLVIACCNYNCPGQLVIGGEMAALETAVLLLRERGAKRCLPLKTSGAFHTALMRPAAAKLAQRLADTPLQAQKIPVVFNATAKTAADAEVRELLARQIASPVLFAQSLQTLAASGAEEVIEVGPGRVLAGFIRKTVPSIEVKSIQNADDLLEVIGF
jgi:[acyl-carrier-protein] S-malonyltransferase